jgi:hypothetical protein
MINLDKDWLQEHGVNVTSDTELEDLTSRIDGRIRKRMYILIPGELTKKKLAEYDKMWDDNKDVALEEEWLSKNLSNYEQFCDRVKQFVGEEISAAKYKKAMIKSWGKATKASPSNTSSKLNVDRSWLRELGVDSVTIQSTMDELVDITYHELELRVGEILANAMTNEQLDEFEAINDSQGDDAAFDWINQTLPHYKQVVDEEHEKIGSEIKDAEDKEAIILSWSKERSKS